MKRKRPIFYSIVKFIVGIIIKSYRPRFVGKENVPADGSLIFCSNHIHAFDPGLVMFSTKRTVHFLAKKELFKFPLKTLMKWMGVIPVDRSKRDTNATDAAHDYLAEGKSLCIFPEGTRNRSDDILLPFKYGAVSLAQKTNSMIVPIAVLGEYKLFRKRLVVKIGKPIHVTNMEIAEANDYLRDTIKNMLEE